MLPGRIDRRFRFNPSANGGCTSGSGCIAFWGVFLPRGGGNRACAMAEKMLFYADNPLLQR